LNWLFIRSSRITPFQIPRRSRPVWRNPDKNDELMAVIQVDLFSWRAHVHLFNLKRERAAAICEITIEDFKDGPARTLARSGGPRSSSTASSWAPSDGHSAHRGR
jgi:hypothetical protein